MIDPAAEAATLATRAALRQSIWAGSTKGEKKLVLLRLCEEADASGIATLKMGVLAEQVGQHPTIVRKIVARLINRGDLRALRGCAGGAFELTPRQ